MVWLIIGNAGVPSGPGPIGGMGFGGSGIADRKSICIGSGESLRDFEDNGFTNHPCPALYQITCVMKTEMMHLVGMKTSPLIGEIGKFKKGERYVWRMAAGVHPGSHSPKAFTGNRRSWEAQIMIFVVFGGFL